MGRQRRRSMKGPRGGYYAHSGIKARYPGSEKLSPVCAEWYVTGWTGRVIVTRFPDAEERQWIMSDNACVGREDNSRQCFGR